MMINANCCQCYCKGDRRKMLMLGSESEQAAQTTVQIEQCAAQANLCRQRSE